jgi:hypothetical protein
MTEVNETCWYEIPFNRPRPCMFHSLNHVLYTCFNCDGAPKILRTIILENIKFGYNFRVMTEQFFEYIFNTMQIIQFGTSVLRTSHNMAVIGCKKLYV